MRKRGFDLYKSLNHLLGKGSHFETHGEQVNGGDMQKIFRIPEIPCLECLWRLKAFWHLWFQSTKIKILLVKLRKIRFQKCFYFCSTEECNVKKWGKVAGSCSFTRQSARLLIFKNLNTMFSVLPFAFYGIYVMRLSYQREIGMVGGRN